MLYIICKIKNTHNTPINDTTEPATKLYSINTKNAIITPQNNFLNIFSPKNNILYFYFIYVLPFNGQSFI